MSGTAVGIAAALAFAAMYFLLNVGFLPALVLSGGLYVGLAVFSVVRDRVARKTTGTERRAAGGGGKRAARAPLNVDLSGLSITQEEFESALREGSKKLATLKRAAERISDRGVRGKAYAVCDAVARILSDIRDDPKDLKP
ncbi:MAG: 5-bromo-4-chloroindolyl phosphate hydrolysis family protein, partial [Spirochaetales bacterium]|nr:5-bromo-4-chloroindolyl phosphate hydrolysis family protein [Spirochaetales bacterium]